MKELADQDLDDGQTLMFFTSDNGPALTRFHPYGSTGPLRAKKGYMYEGGIRVPGIVRWPGQIEPGQVSDQPVCGVDLLPTLCELTGVPVPSDRVIDGASVLPLFDGEPIVASDRSSGSTTWQAVTSRLPSAKAIGRSSPPSIRPAQRQERTSPKNR